MAFGNRCRRIRIAAYYLPRIASTIRRIANGFNSGGDWSAGSYSSFESPVSFDARVLFGTQSALTVRRRRGGWRRISPLRRCRNHQNLNTIPAESCAVWVAVFVFQLWTRKVGAPYTRPRYSRRNAACRARWTSAPPP